MSSPSIDTQSRRRNPPRRSMFRDPELLSPLVLSPAISPLKQRPVKKSRVVPDEEEYDQVSTISHMELVPNTPLVTEEIVPNTPEYTYNSESEGESIHEESERSVDSDNDSEDDYEDDDAEDEEIEEISQQSEGEDDLADLLVKAASYDKRIAQLKLEQDLLVVDAIKIDCRIRKLTNNARCSPSVYVFHRSKCELQ